MWVAALGKMLTETSYCEIIMGTSRALSGHSYVAAILEIRALSVSVSVKPSYVAVILETRALSVSVKPSYVAAILEIRALSVSAKNTLSAQ
jgi:hypothetical protein